MVAMVTYQSHLFSLSCVPGLQDLVDGVLQALQAARRMVEVTEMSDPAKVAYTVKQLAREAAVGKTRSSVCLSVCLSVSHYPLICSHPSFIPILFYSPSLLLLSLRSYQVHSHVSAVHRQQAGDEPQ